MFYGYYRYCFQHGEEIEEMGREVRDRRLTWLMVLSLLVAGAGAVYLGFAVRVHALQQYERILCDLPLAPLPPLIISHDGLGGTVFLSGLALSFVAYYVRGTRRSKDWLAGERKYPI